MKFQIGLNFYSTAPLLFEPSELDDKKLRDYIAQNKYHIYVVCKRKKMYYHGTEVVEKGCKTTLYYLDENHDKQFQDYLHSLEELEVLSSADHKFNVKLNGKELVMPEYCLISYLDTIKTDTSNDLPSDLEVLYIGQAFGRTEVKTIDYRISNHEKVQKIALDIIKKGSNEEILVIGLKVLTNDFGTSIAKFGTKNVAPSYDYLKGLVKSAGIRLSEGQEVTVYEASLIKYFKPHLNTEYKETFPSKDFKSYNELFDTDFDYSAMAIDTLPLFLRLYSKELETRKYLHSNHYPLTTKSDKKEFFEYIYELNE